MSDAPTLELRGISKAFGSVQALEEVDFEVRDGEVMALVGDNGAGKSTLIKSVAVARAVMWNSRVVILDEPTAALGVAQTRQVLDLVKRLAEQGLAVVLISHNLHDIFEAATRITVLRLGRVVGVYERAQTTQQEIVQAITAGIPTKVAGIAETGAEAIS